VFGGSITPIPLSAADRTRQHGLRPLGAVD
jgi:hypothetical protein